MIPVILQVTLPACQSGSVDCELFAVAYATVLAIGNNPEEITYDQCEMSNHLLDCYKSKQPSFVYKNKYDILLNYNNEQQLDADFSKNVRSVEEHKQETAVVSDTTTTIIKNKKSHTCEEGGAHLRISV